MSSLTADVGSRSHRIANLVIFQPIGDSYRWRLVCQSGYLENAFYILRGLPQFVQLLGDAAHQSPCTHGKTTDPNSSTQWKSRDPTPVPHLPDCQTVEPPCRVAEFVSVDVRSIKSRKSAANQNAEEAIHAREHTRNPHATVVPDKPVTYNEVLPELLLSTNWHVAFWGTWSHQQVIMRLETRAFDMCLRCALRNECIQRSC